MDSDSNQVPATKKVLMINFNFHRSDLEGHWSIGSNLKPSFSQRTYLYCLQGFDEIVIVNHCHRSAVRGALDVAGFRYIVKSVTAQRVQSMWSPWSLPIGAQRRPSRDLRSWDCSISFQPWKSGEKLWNELCSLHPHHPKGVSKNFSHHHLQNGLRGRHKKSNKILAIGTPYKHN